MKSNKIYVDIDMNGNQLLNSVFEHSSVDLVAPERGQFYYNTSTNRIKYFNGSEWVEFVDDRSIRPFHSGAVGTQSLTTSYQQLNIFENVIVDNIRYTTTNTELTFLERGTYYISISGTTDTTNNSRTTSSMRSLVDRGSGYNTITGTERFYYNRNSSDGKSSANATYLLEVDAGDKITIEVRGDGGNEVTVADTFAVTIFKLTDESSLPQPPFSSLVTTLNGLDQYIEFSSSDFNYDIGTPFSYSLWIYPISSSGGFRNCITKGTQGSNGYSFGLNSADNSLKIVFATTASSMFIRTNQQIPVNQWSHVVFSYNGGTSSSDLSVYIDNLPATFTYSTTFNGSMTNTNPFCIGAALNNFGSSREFDGHLDEISVFSKALTSAEVGTIWGTGSPTDLGVQFGTDPDFVAWYRLGEIDSTTTAFDSQGSTNGTKRNMTTTNIIAR